MLWYADSSFLFSLYHNDKHTSKALAFVESEQSILASELAEFELMQAVRLRMFQHDHQQIIGLSRDVGRAILNQFNRDIEAGLFQRFACNWPNVFKQANTLSADYTREGGHRSIDLLHLAVAKELGVTAFLTFDNKQQALAKILGFEISFA